MKCTICGQPIRLSPSAAERAKRHGGKPADYTAQFTAHIDCAVRKREEENRALIKRLRTKR